MYYYLYYTDISHAALLNVDCTGVLLCYKTARWGKSSEAPKTLRPQLVTAPLPCSPPSTIDLPPYNASQAQGQCKGQQSGGKR